MRFYVSRCILLALWVGLGLVADTRTHAQSVVGVPPSANLYGTIPDSVPQASPSDRPGDYGFNADAEWDYSHSNRVEPDSSPRPPSRGKLVNIEGGENAEVGTFRETGSELEEIDLNHPLQFGDRIRVPKLRHASHHPYTDYRVDESSMTYLPGDGDQFGMLSFEGTPYLASGRSHGFTNSMSIHLLSGPETVHLPARLYDFSFGYQMRGQFDSALSYDVGTSVGVFSDFEDSARDGVRFPGHAVVMLHTSPETDWVLGIDYLDRDDIKLLPVFGISRHSEYHPNMRFDLVFPRPQIEFGLDSGKSFYIGGRLGGGTWDIELPDESNDVFTYKDYRLLFGIRQPKEESISTFEVGYVFGRQLDFRTAFQQTELDDAFMMRWVTLR